MVKSFVQVLRNSSIAVVTLTKRLGQVTISTLISIYSDLIQKKPNITPEKVIFNALFQQSEQIKLANQLRALIWLSKSVNKIKKTSEVISHATFVLNVFFDVKFVITKKG